MPNILSILTYIPLLAALIIVFFVPKEKTKFIKVFYNRGLFP